MSQPLPDPQTFPHLASLPMLLPTLILTLHHVLLTDLPAVETIPLHLPAMNIARATVRSPYAAQMPVVPPMPATKTASPYAIIHHPEVVAPPPQELVPAPQILEPPARWLPGSAGSRPKLRSAQPPQIPKPIPLIPLDQIPESMGSRTPTRPRVTTYCQWQ